MMNDLSIDQLRSLVTIAETNSFTQAARKLFRTQPALSLQIKRLEEHVGTPLVLRNGRSIGMTEAGQVLVDYARRILDLNEEALAKLSLTETEGKVRIGVLEEVTIGPLVDLLTKFGRLCTKVELELEVGTSWNLSRMIKSNDLCLAVANLDYAEDNATPLWQENYYWAYSAFYDLPADESLPIILEPDGYPCALRDHALDVLKGMKRSWHVTFSSYSLTAMIAAVHAGLGLGLIAESAITDDMSLLESSDALPCIPPATIGLYRSREATSRAVNTLAEFLKDHLQKHPFS